MNRRDFLKTCLTAMAGIFILKWIKPLSGETAPGRLTEAKFYKSADTLPG